MFTRRGFFGSVVGLAMFAFAGVRLPAKRKSTCVVHSWNMSEELYPLKRIIVAVISGKPPDLHDSVRLFPVTTGFRRIQIGIKAIGKNVYRLTIKDAEISRAVA